MPTCVEDGPYGGGYNQLSTLDFTDTAQNVVLIGGPGTGKTHLATAIGVAGIAAKGKRVRFYSTVDLVNQLEKEKRDGKAGGIAFRHSTMAAKTRIKARESERKGSKAAPATQDADESF